MSNLRLGDVIDDFCVKCRRLTNHAVVSIVNGEAAKVRCRTCYHEHDFRKGEPPPKKVSKKEALFKEVLSGINPSAAGDGTPAEAAEPSAEAPEPPAQAPEPPAETAAEPVESEVKPEPKKKARAKKAE